MSSLQLLAPLVGAGIGAVAAYGATHRPLNKRIHFVDRGNLESELDDLDIDVAGAETCAVCEREIQPSEIGAVVREDDDYRVICDRPECLDTYDLQ